MKVAVIGGGAAGFFAAISCKKHYPNAHVTIFEKSSKLLAKVKISGGGRCNVTHACHDISQLVKSYPRGGKQLKKAFHQFHVPDTIDWFESRGVPLKSEEDGRMFPTSDNSQSIINCLLKQAERDSIHIQLNSQIFDLIKHPSGIEIKSNRGALKFDKVIIATGGSPKLSGFNWLKNTGHSIEHPVPSLFTFNLHKEPITKFMGIVVKDAEVRIQGTKLIQSGPVLITHWGLSGPAVLKLSAWGARKLHNLDYQFIARINWTGRQTEDELRDYFKLEMANIGKRKVQNRNPFNIPIRLWEFLLIRSDIQIDMTWNDLGKKKLNKLVNTLTNDTYQVKGKTTFKEEFVTCGGIALSEVDFNTMQSRICPNLYFAGEVLDVDGITGGFNFQAAWTTGFIAGKLSS